MVKCMKIRLGYVAISLTLNITASKTITYTNYLKIISKIDKLDEIINQNFNIENIENISNFILNSTGISRVILRNCFKQISIIVII